MGESTKFKREGKDDMEIKKMNEQIQESLMMIPDCHRRLEKAVKGLKNLVNELEVDFPLSVDEGTEVSPGAKEISEAKEALKESEEHLKAD